MSIYETKLNENVVQMAKNDRAVLAILRDTSPESPREWDNLGTMVCWHNRYILGNKQPKCTHYEWLRELAMEVDPTVEHRIDYWENGKGWAQLCKKYAVVDNDKNKEPRDVIEKTLGQARIKVDRIIQDALAKHVILLPLALLDHSGLHMYIGSKAHWSDPGGWDSGQVGYVYVTREEAKKEIARPKPLKKGQLNPDLKRIKHLTEKDIQRVKEILEGEVETYDQYLRGDVYGFVLETPDGEEIDSCWGFYGDNPKENGMADHLGKEYAGLIDELEYVH